jgi:hypothetical protein
MSLFGNASNIWFNGNNPSLVYLNGNLLWTGSIVTSSALYEFTTFTFTNAGATGPYGPSYQSLLTYYTSSASWASNNTYFTSSGRGVQEWKVPVTATYRITAAGAAGGNSPTLTGQAASGGFGALIETDVQLTQGSVIEIVVGQMGQNRFTGSGASAFNGASGGGGTFVYESSSLTYYVAVGGGGGAAGATANLFTNQATASGKWDTTSGSRANYNATIFALGGVGGNGGGISNRTPSPILFGAPGAGILNSGSLAHKGNGLSRLDGWLGGGIGAKVGINFVSGGFGGGGAAFDGDNTADAQNLGFAGGGGGYSGGAPGGNSGQSNSSHGGGGGSYYIGTLVSGSSNANRTHGWVKITKL